MRLTESVSLNPDCVNQYFGEGSFTDCNGRETPGHFFNAQALSRQGRRKLYLANDDDGYSKENKNKIIERINGIRDTQFAWFALSERAEYKVD